jgi:hypothetical protein
LSSKIASLSPTGGADEHPALPQRRRARAPFEHPLDLTLTQTEWSWAWTQLVYGARLQGINTGGFN